MPGVRPLAPTELTIPPAAGAGRADVGPQTTADLEEDWEIVPSASESGWGSGLRVATSRAAEAGDAARRPPGGAFTVCGAAVEGSASGQLCRPPATAGSPVATTPRSASPSGAACRALRQPLASVGCSSSRPSTPPPRASPPATPPAPATSAAARPGTSRPARRAPAGVDVSTPARPTMAAAAWRPPPPPAPPPPPPYPRHVWPWAQVAEQVPPGLACVIGAGAGGYSPIQPCLVPPGPPHFEALMAALRTATASLPRRASLTERLTLAAHIRGLLDAAWAAHPPHPLGALHPADLPRGRAHRDRWRQIIDQLVQLLLAHGQVDLAEHCHALACRCQLEVTMAAVSRLSRALAGHGRLHALCRVLSGALCRRPRSDQIDEIIARVLPIALRHRQPAGEGALTRLYEVVCVWVTGDRHGLLPARLGQDLVDAIIRGRHGLLARRLRADAVAGTLAHPIGPSAWASLGHLAAEVEPAGGTAERGPTHPG